MWAQQQLLFINWTDFLRSEKKVRFCQTLDKMRRTKILKTTDFEKQNGFVIDPSKVPNDLLS